MKVDIVYVKFIPTSENGVKVIGYDVDCNALSSVDFAAGKSLTASLKYFRRYYEHVYGRKCKLIYKRP